MNLQVPPELEAKLTRLAADRVRPTSVLIATIVGAYDPIVRASGHALQVITGPAPARAPQANVFRLNFALTTSGPYSERSRSVAETRAADPMLAK